MLVIDGWVVRYGDRSPSYCETAPRGSVRRGVELCPVWVQHDVENSGRASQQIGAATVAGGGGLGRLAWHDEGVRLTMPVLAASVCQDAAALVSAGALTGWSMEAPMIPGLRRRVADGWVLQDARIVGVALVPRPAYPLSTVRLLEV